MKTLALFDFDGTLTTKDSFIELIKFKAGLLKYIIGMISMSPMLIMFKLGLIKNYNAKQRVIKYFFGGISFHEFQNLCHRFVAQKVPKLIREQALVKFNTHIEKGHDVFIVSASVVNWVQPWADAYNVEVLGTSLVLNDNCITGEIEGKNCYGYEKVKRILEKVNLSDYAEIFVYGDSAGDKEMLELATQPFYRVFD